MRAASAREQRYTFEAVVRGMEVLITFGRQYSCGRQYSENTDRDRCRLFVCRSLIAGESERENKLCRQSPSHLAVSKL
jgi:hypothetical protein